YVLRNTEKHGVIYNGGPDPFSSGESFDGWRQPVNHAESAAGAMTSAVAVVADIFGRARTWLLRVGWRGHGLIGWGERSLAENETSAGPSQREAGLERQAARGQLRGVSPRGTQRPRSPVPLGCRRRTERPRSDAREARAPAVRAAAATEGNGRRTAPLTPVP